MTLFIAPHNDDEALFGSFTLLRYKPLVLIVFDSYVQKNRGYGITASQRRLESLAGCAALGCTVEFLGFRDDRPDWNEIYKSLDRYADYERPVFAPAFEENGHDQHNIVSEVCTGVFQQCRYYMTYTRTGGKSCGVEVPYEPGWIAKKLRALSCYESQASHPSTQEHFIRSQEEYYKA